jgi:hypothetical protein
MSTTPWQIKNIPEELRRRFKAAAMLQGKTIGEAMVEAMEAWIAAQKKKSG